MRLVLFPHRIALSFGIQYFDELELVPDDSWERVGPSIYIMASAVVLFWQSGKKQCSFWGRSVLRSPHVCTTYVM